MVPSPNKPIDGRSDWAIVNAFKGRLFFSLSASSGALTRAEGSYRLQSKGVAAAHLTNLCSAHQSQSKLLDVRTFLCFAWSLFLRLSQLFLRHLGCTSLVKRPMLRTLRKWPNKLFQLMAIVVLKRRKRTTALALRLISLRRTMGTVCPISKIQFLYFLTTTIMPVPLHHPWSDLQDLFCNPLFPVGSSTQFVFSIRRSRSWSTDVLFSQAYSLSPPFQPALCSQMTHWRTTLANDAASAKLLNLHVDLHPSAYDFPATARAQS